MKKLILSIGASAILLTSGCSFMPTGDITHNVYFANQDLSNTPQSKVNTIVKDYFLKAPQAVTLVDKNGKKLVYPISELGIEPDVWKTAWNIKSYGYEPKMGDLIASRWESLFNKVSIKPIYKVNQMVSEVFYKNLASELKMPSTVGTLDVVDNKVVYTPPPAGEIIDMKKTTADIVAMLERGESKPIQLTYRNGVPDSKEAQLLKSMDTILGTYTTEFNTGAVNRSHNIALATKKVNGVIIAPGQEFSYNKVVGKRTSAAGFESAPVIVGGHLVPGIGGGICQLSSTIFNAALYSGMKIIERTPHYEPVGYIPAGHDATVSYGSLDFVFKNPLKHSVYVLTHLHGGVLTVYILGNKEDKYKSVTVSEIGRSLIPNRIIVKRDKGVAGTKVEEYGHNGLSVENRRTMVKQDGTVITDTYSSYYDPLDRVVVEGVKKPEDKKKKEGNTTKETKKVESKKSLHSDSSSARKENTESEGHMVNLKQLHKH